ncbi:histidine kinase dimerization/phosphoacceptor domain-containing protein [Glutamicibacter halophytocola]|uniref:sensor histidine kinase n=1 Tax=Glutamicibacter halophytocola TaxID=1933880 RepID=UPI00321A8025
MTSTPWSLAGTSTGRPPLKLGLTLLHLAVLGSFGTIGLSPLIAWLALGLGLVPPLGIGLLFLAALLATLFAVARAEILRISGLYGIDAVPPHWPARRGPGFGEYLRTLGRALGDGRMWAALGSLVLSCIAGTIMLGVLQWTVHFAIISFAPLSSAETVAGPFSPHTPAAQAPWLMLLAIAGAGLVIGTAFLHRSITVGIIGSLARETELTERVRSTTVRREGAVRAAEVERTRIERDLHDGVQPRLVSVAMTLGLAHQQIDSNPEQAKELVAEAHASTKSAITELRQLTRGIYASVLDDRGLDAALSAVAGRSHIPVQLDVQLQGRYPPGGRSGRVLRDRRSADQRRQALAGPAPPGHRAGARSQRAAAPVGAG